MTRYRNHDMEDVTAPLDHTTPEGDNESSNEYSEETDTHHLLAEFLEQFSQCQDQYACLKSATYHPTPMAELTYR